MEPSNTELILIRITGEDRPGLTSSIMGILARYDVTVLDIGQADIHNTLTLGLLVRAAEEYSGHVMRDLLFKASELGVNIRFYPVKKDEYADWVNMQGKNRYILTLLGRKLSALQIQAVTSVLAEQGLNIDAIKRLTGRIPLDEQRENIRACIEFSVRGTPKDRAAMQSKLLKLSSELEMDFSFQLDNMYRRMRRLICFDMDSTLIETEVIDELADRAGVGEQVRAITEQAMRGEIDFKESFTQRVTLLKGLDVTNITYFGNQAWPYPSGLMVGFIADYAGGEIKLQEEELSSGDFYTRDNLPELPRKLSLARKMIDWWLECSHK